MRKKCDTKSDTNRNITNDIGNNLRVQKCDTLSDANRNIDIGDNLREGDKNIFSPPKT